MSIEVANESGIEVDEPALIAVAQFALARMDVHPAAELSMTLVDMTTMADLHVRWMDLPGPTDVMSFPMDEIVPGGRPDATVPDPQDPATFRSATLNWAEPEGGDHRRMHAFVRDLLRLRARTFTEPGTLDDVEPDYGDDWFVLRRAPVTVAVNRSGSAQTLPGVTGTVLLSFADAEPVVTAGATTVASHGVVVLGAAHE